MSGRQPSMPIHEPPGRAGPDKALVLIGLAGALVVVLILVMAWLGTRLVEEPTAPPVEAATPALDTRNHGQER